MRWSWVDTVLVAGLLLASGVVRFWHLGHPATAIFDEITFVGQAGSYLRGEMFFDPHPPLAVELIALCMRLLGDYPVAWRLANATIGSILVGLTYVLGRQMFESRLAASLAALFIAGDGLFLVESRVAVIDIWYVTFAALAYVCLFRFVQECSPRVLVAMGVALGLCLGSKLYVPAFTFVLVGGFMAYALLAEPHNHPCKPPRPQQFARVMSALLMLGSVAALIYLTVFLPNFVQGRWGGLAALWQYYGDVVHFESSPLWPDPRNSPWWSWPLMLHPFMYWQHLEPAGRVVTIWAGGNPVVWWGAVAAILVTAARLPKYPSFVSAFLLAGYAGYLLILAPIGRGLYLYHYMPALYLGSLALGTRLSDCWRNEAGVWEQVVLLSALVPALLLGLGGRFGEVTLAGIVGTWASMQWRWARGGVVVCAAFVAAALIAFLYFLPLWLGAPISETGFQARMWLKGPGLCNWHVAAPEWQKMD